jgi:hypothetical protein
MLLSAANVGNIAVLQRIATRDNIHFKYGLTGASLLHFAALDGILFLRGIFVGNGHQSRCPEQSGFDATSFYCVGRALTPNRAKIVKLLLTNGASLENKG